IKTEDNPDGKKHILRNRVNNTSFKKCTPMLDTLTTGYLIPLWSDVLVEQTMSGPLINWRVHRDVFGMHDSHAERVERPPGYNQLVFKYISSWIVTTPPGYSILVTSPYGFRKSTPFKVIDAIIDSDTSQHDLTIPCWLEDGFEGIKKEQSAQ
ncbi:MAG: hypothetical protein EBZ08_12690, partial [Betaproteobacteria bacterium]|nr:hypothetical protein [Betaproteobacteria bacterium]